jgi:hypothetical protein
VSWPDPDWFAHGACFGKPEVFFPKEDTVATVIEARTLCSACPVYENCASWGLANYLLIPSGILFGYRALDRFAFYSGQATYVDWRASDWRRGTRDPLAYRQRRRGVLDQPRASREREAYKRGVQAVVDAYHLYEIDDVAERVRIISAYQAWQEEQHWVTDYRAAQERVEHIAGLRYQREMAS